MLLLESCVIALLLSFSYKIIERILRVVSKQQERFAVYYWGVAMIGVSVLWKNSYTFGTMQNVKTVLPLFLVSLLGSLLISRSSGYSPLGTSHTINFLLAPPSWRRSLSGGWYCQSLRAIPHSVSFTPIPSSILAGLS